MSPTHSLTIGNTTNPTKHLTLYVDTISPFAYLAYYTLRRAPIFISSPSLAITFTPVFLGGIMGFTGNKPPIAIKNKGDYTIRDMRRWATRFDIPVTMDGVVEGFPVNTLKVQRAILALNRSCPEDPEVALGFIDLLYVNIWVKKVNIAKDEELRRILGEHLEMLEKKGVAVKCGVDDVIKIADTDEEIKAVLNANTKDALDTGAFGLPYFVARNDETCKTDTFFGFDHLGQIADFLGLEWPIGGGGSDEVKDWKKGFKALL